MGKTLEIIRRKPIVFILISLVYLFLIIILHWRGNVNSDTLAFLVGGLFGVYFLDFAEVFFNLSPSPFRTIVFEGLFVIVSFFVVTSSGSALASGLVLSLFLTIILWQIGEWRIRGNLVSWYRMVAQPVFNSTQKLLFYLSILLFILETLLFIRT